MINRIMVMLRSRYPVIFDGLRMGIVCPEFLLFRFFVSACILPEISSKGLFILNRLMLPIVRQISAVEVLFGVRKY